MDNTSFSKGIFVNKGKYKLGKRKNVTVQSDYPYPWYKAYNNSWTEIKRAAEQINVNLLKQVLSNLYKFVLRTKDSTHQFNEIPTAALMTGVNLQDHDILFGELMQRIRRITPYIAIVSSRNCINLKILMEDTISQFLQNEDTEDFTCKTFHDLDRWHELHEKNLSNKPFIVIVPEFESIHSNILSDFILTLSCHNSNTRFVLIFGLATSIRAVHSTFSYNIISKLQIEVYHMPQQLSILNDIIEGTMISTKSSFRLIGRGMQLLADNFLFNELSVNGYLQSYKICMIILFFNKNFRILCCKSTDLNNEVEHLNSEDISCIRAYPSVAREIEKKEKERNKSLNESEFKKLLVKLVKNFHDYMDSFIIMLKCFYVFIQGMPQNKYVFTLRDIYVQAISDNFAEIEEYKRLICLFKLLSKEELLKRLESIISIIKESGVPALQKIIVELKQHINIINNASFEIKNENEINAVIALKKNRRSEFKKTLQQNAQQSRSEFQIAQSNIVDYLDKKIFSVYLQNPNKIPGHEIFYFNSSVVKPHIVGSMKGTIHKAITNPQVYLQCSCCKAESDRILPEMLDVSIIFKLHAEHIKLINMYDWLQAFLTIVNPSSEGEQREVDPKLRARFMQAVADLEHLGFIKVSKRKVDHVKRLCFI